MTAQNNELVLLPSLKAERGAHGGLIITKKYLTGAAEHAKTWPGPVTSLLQLRDTPTSDMDPVEVTPGDGSSRLELRPDTEAGLARRLRAAAVVVAFLAPNEAPTVELCRRLGIPLVFVSEYSYATEKQIIDAEVANPLLRWRRKLWVMRAERIRVAALQRAAGVQCSGWPAYQWYRRHNRNALLYFDNRVREADVASDAELAHKARNTLAKPLRLVFGARLIAMKGVLQLPKVAMELKRRNVDFTLDIYGRGALEGQLQAEIVRLGLQRQVALRGVVDFDSEWLPLLKRRADVFVCCHPQGDPSSTYPEVMSCGVPIAGYANEAFAGIVGQSESGWVAPIYRPAELAATLARLATNPGEIATHAQRGRDFARLHSFERTFSARTEHFLRSSERCHAALP